MKFTFYWLKKFIDLKEDNLEAVLDALTSLGMEVESVTHPQASLSDFLVGEIIESYAHPGADTLNICKVDVGQGEGLLEVVCGASNVRPGLKVVYAKIGSVVPVNGMTIERKKIRGVESEGMLCSDIELCMGSNAGFIMELDQTCAVGSRFVDACPWADDCVIEIAVTPNRPDWLGVYGVARDLSAYGLGTMRELSSSPVVTEPCPIAIEVSDVEACPLFMGRMISGVDNTVPTALWLKTLLYRIGHSSISPIVDITNYINFSFNRPMHAYDAGAINGARMSVRFARPGETMMPIGSQAGIELSASDLVVADTDKVCALAGIIGDDRSKCLRETSNIFLEAAVFKPELVYKTGRRYAINTDSKYRFERGVDLNFTEVAMNIAVDMIIAQCQGIATEVLVSGNRKSEPRFISLNLHKISKLIGLTLPVETVIQTLEALGFACQKQIERLEVSIPSWRNDVTIQEDLLEEVIRVIGYDKIPMVPITAVLATRLSTLAGSVRTLLAASGYDENITWSFMSSKVAATFDLLKHSLVITNPLSVEMDVMRHSILPNLLECIAKNNARSFKNLALFEIGDVFKQNGDQSRMVCAVRSGMAVCESIYHDARDFDFFDCKADVINILNHAFNVDEQDIRFVIGEAPSYYHPGKSAFIMVGDIRIGFIGVIHPGILNGMEVSHSTVAFEVFLEDLKHHKQPKRFLPSDYQPVVRDFAFVMNSNVPAQALLNAVQASESGGLIKTISFFDVFQSDELGLNKKSLAIKLVLQAQDRTLTADEINKFSDSLISAVLTKIDGATLRV